MSMALALEFTAEWFRSKNGWKHNECGIQEDALPSLEAGSFYVSIDDGGVESGNATTDSLKEIVSISVGVWRRINHLTKDRRPSLKLPNDKYLLGSWTLHDLERQVILPNRNGLHQNWSFMTALNERYNLPSAEEGADFRFPFVYLGRSRMQKTVLPDGRTSVETWYGYTLRFRGLAREQHLRSSTYALG